VPYQSRYYFAILPALLLPLAVALSRPWSALGPHAERARRVAAAASMAALVGISALKTYEYLSSEPVELLPASRALEATARPGDRIVLRKGHLAFLAGLEMVVTRGRASPSELVDWASANGARFLYVGPMEVKENAALAPLAAGIGSDARLELLHRSESPSACLYEVVAR
jgi:hypothetical protein